MVISFFNFLAAVLLLSGSLKNLPTSFLYAQVYIILSWEILIVARYFVRHKEREVFIHDGGYDTFVSNRGTVGFLIVFGQYFMFKRVEEWGKIASDSYHLIFEVKTFHFAIVLAILFSCLNVWRFSQHKCKPLLASALGTIALALPLAIMSSNFLAMTVPVVFLAGNQGPDHFNRAHIKGGERTLRVLRYTHFGLSIVYFGLAVASVFAL